MSIMWPDAHSNINTIWCQTPAVSFIHVDKKLLTMHPQLHKIYKTAYVFVNLLILVEISLGNLVENYYLQARGRSLMRDPVSGINFAVLNKHHQKYLDVSAFRVLLFKDEKLCELSCVGSRQCFSFNLVADGGMLRCELLSNDMFNSSQNFINKTNSVHFSIKVRSSVSFPKYITLKTSSFIIVILMDFFARFHDLI